MPTLTVLVVEDEPAVRRGVAAALRADGLAVLEQPRGDGAVERAVHERADAVLLDVGLPGRDGFEVLRELRAARPELPILMLTARGAEDDRVRGLELGADDYVVKPFSARELVARVRAVLRRTERPLEVDALRIGRRTIDLARRQVRLEDGRREDLTERDAELLRYLAARRDRAVARRELLRQLWDCDPEGIETRTVDMQVSRLREKVEPDPSRPRVIVTVRGVGYRLGDEVIT